jgi:hypothetical protein
VPAASATPARCPFCAVPSGGSPDPADPARSPGPAGPAGSTGSTGSADWGTILTLAIRRPASSVTVKT